MKTVFLFIKHVNLEEEGHPIKRFVETIVVGKKQHWKTAADAVRDMQKTYTRCNNSASIARFEIENIIVVKGGAR